jgi:hypothetical protein
MVGLQNAVAGLRCEEEIAALLELEIDGFVGTG